MSWTDELAAISGRMRMRAQGMQEQADVLQAVMGCTEQDQQRWRDLRRFAHALVVWKCAVFHCQGSMRALGRDYVYQVYNQTAKALGIPGPIGTHSARKTFGTETYRNFCQAAQRGELLDPLRETAKALGHADINSTDKYLPNRNDLTRQAIMDLGDAWQLIP